MHISNVLIVCHYAQQPPLNTMLRYHNWGKELVTRGYNVTIIAASTIHNTDIDFIEKTGKNSDFCDGIHYKYIRTPHYKGNGLHRIKNMLAFCFGLKKYSNIRADVVITCEAYLYPFVRHYFKNAPVITDTVDLWPESIIEYGNYSKRNPLIWSLYRLERKAYVSSDALVFSIEGGVDYLREQSYSDQIDYNKVFHINMGCDLVAFDNNLNSFSDELPWDMGKFNIVYCGSLRTANQVMGICEAAKILNDTGVDLIDIHIYGNGDQYDVLRKFVDDNSLPNVHFYGRFKKEDLPGILSRADASLLTYKQVRLMKYGGSQSKLFDYLASGTPIVSNAEWGYDLLKRYSCGLISYDQSAKAFADTLLKISLLPKDELDAMGIRARSVAELYSLPKLVDSLCNVFSWIEAK